MAFAHASSAPGSSTPTAPSKGATCAAPPARSPRALAAAGLREGGVVALALDPARALLPALVAAWEIGATVVLVPPALGPAELAPWPQGLAPALIVTAAGDAARIAGATGGTATRARRPRGCRRSH